MGIHLFFFTVFLWLNKLLKMSKKINFQFGVITLMILVAATTRLLPHPPNFTAVGAMGLFGAAFFNRKVFAFIIPLAAMYMTDLFLNNVVYAQYIPEGHGFLWFTEGAGWIYGGIALTIVAGFFIFKKVNIASFLGGSLISALIFFLLSNFGVWSNGILYPMNAAGLAACFAAGIPYLLNSILSNLFFGGILFGSYYAIQQRFFPTTALN